MLSRSGLGAETDPKALAENHGDDHTRNLAISMGFDAEFITTLIEQGVFGNQAELSVWGDDVGCNDFTLFNPMVSIERHQLYIIANARARTGWHVGNRCIGLVKWQGKIKALQVATIIDPRGKISFTTKDTELLNSDGNRSRISSRLWDLAKDNIHPHLDTLSINLIPAIKELKQLLPLFLDPHNRKQSELFIDSLHLQSLSVDPDSLSAQMRFDLVTHALAPPLDTEQPLSKEELKNFIEVWEKWDAFLSFVVKVAARNILDRDQRDVLLEILIDTRYAVVDALTFPDPRQDDPIRDSFIQAWQRLAPIFRNIPEQIKGRESLRFLSFIAAADALAAIDQLGPVTGWDISVNGLRRLARLLLDDATVDPLEDSPEVDGELRELFEFGPKIILPAKPITTPTNPDIESSDTSEADSPGHHILGYYRPWVLTFISDAEANDSDIDINRLTPTNDNLFDYLQAVRDLLHQNVDQVLVQKPLADAYHLLYRHLVLATAWQETCWRQYIRQDVHQAHRLKTITSSAGALGIMQIMPRVWRGFYDTDALANSIRYNALAGSEILHRYLVRYAIRKGEHQQPGGEDNLAKASYAAYNGGPRHLNRYRKPTTSASLKRIDQNFWKKFLQIRDGDELAVTKCYGIRADAPH